MPQLREMFEKIVECPTQKKNEQADNSEVWAVTYWARAMQRQKKNYMADDFLSTSNTEAKKRRGQKFVTHVFLRFEIWIL
jgi:hypothetical protein